MDSYVRIVQLFMILVPSDDNVHRFCFHGSGKWLGSRHVRCNWAMKGAASSDDKQNSNANSVVELTNGSSGELC
ncbi:hypothetical protein U1Q18_011755 [Sarracenia purpurea var. burkii]